MEEFNFMDGKLYYRKNAAEQWRSLDDNVHGQVIANRLNEHVKLITTPNKDAVRIINKAMRELRRETGSYELKEKYMLLVGASMELGRLKGYNELSKIVNQKGKELVEEVSNIKTVWNHFLILRILRLIKKKFLEVYDDVKS